jgi:hypothetical protein
MAEEPKESREAKRKRQVDEIHAALGRYVEAFERVVAWIRTGCVFLTSLTVQPPKNIKQQQLMNVVFNHRSMTADNLLRIYRALVGEIVNDKDTTFDPKERVAITGVIRQFDKDFQEAVNTRNDYLHGTWYIGWGNASTEDWSEIGFSRAKATNEGLRFVKGPKSAADIDALTEECGRLTDFFLRFHGCLLLDLIGQGPLRVTNNFTLTGKKEDQRWIVNPPTT